MNGLPAFLHVSFFIFVSCNSVFLCFWIKSCGIIITRLDLVKLADDWWNQNKIFSFPFSETLQEHSYRLDAQGKQNTPGGWFYSGCRYLFEERKLWLNSIWRSNSFCVGGFVAIRCICHMAWLQSRSELIFLYPPRIIFLELCTWSWLIQTKHLYCYHFQEFSA